MLWVFYYTHIHIYREGGEGRETPRGDKGFWVSWGFLQGETVARHLTLYKSHWLGRQEVL